MHFKSSTPPEATVYPHPFAVAKTQMSVKNYFIVNPELSRQVSLSEGEGRGEAQMHTVPTPTEVWETKMSFFKQLLRNIVWLFSNDKSRTLILIERRCYANNSISALPKPSGVV